MTQFKLLLAVPIPTPSDLQKTAMPPAVAPRLQLNHVSQRLAQAAGRPLQGVALLQDISFSVEPGEFVAIVGPAGAGKTSLLRLLNRLSDPTDGQILLDGCDLRQIPILHLRRQVSLVLQESKLLGMTVAEALAYPLHLRGIHRAVIQQRLSLWQERLRLPSEWFDRTELNLSVGQRQQVAIARTLMTLPPDAQSLNRVLLLDEPTAALDARRADFLLSLLRDLAIAQQLTVLMVNHQLDLVERFCSRVLYLQAGQLLQDSAAPQTNWPALRDRLITTERQQAAEWGEV
ncbi:ABC transporter ATP-binding protein [Trichothermofontia sp.]